MMKKKRKTTSKLNALVPINISYITCIGNILWYTNSFTFFRNHFVPCLREERKNSNNVNAPMTLIDRSSKQLGISML